VEEDAAHLYPKLMQRMKPPSKGEGLVESLGDSFAGGLSLEEKEDYRHRRSSGSFAAIKPTRSRPGERTVSTSLRLRRQGFTLSKSGSSDFAVKSIRRGSDEWNGLLRPFVSDLTFRSLEYRRLQSEVSFRPYTCHAAVLFVDLSNYSKITAEISHKGAHAISTAVNAYLSRLLGIVSSYGGDVVKFAGDAVLIVWEGEKGDLEMNILLAARCSLEMQEKAGVYIIEGTPLCFRIHCGLCCGLLESEIFVAPNHVNMQQYFHSVSGECLIEISISNACAEYVGSRGVFKSIDGRDDCKLITKIDLDAVVCSNMESYLEQYTSDRLFRRNKRIEEDFIHPSVLRLLVLGGLSPTQIAQMRNLCVLFIAMTSNGSSVNWLMEVQTILDKNRCPST
jgi:Adenylate and Guanylate cyclase catalytic domain